MINVLIVEDDPMVAELNKNYLQMISGFKLVGIASNGEEALEFIKNHQVSLLLLDVFMPKIDGLSLLQQTRTTHPEIDIIMVTAARSTNDIQTALRLGIIDYIVKPFTFERFQTALISYQERVRLLFSEKELDQSLLDKGIFSKKNISSQNLPKGIDAETLKNIRSTISAYGEDFNVNDIVAVVGLSRISLKKYFDYLEAIGELNSYLTYPAVGRPVRMYHYSH